jgi:glycosyltransferase involved in cell wall biosynthesis
LETGAHGKIAVASDIPGPRDVIIDQQTGFLINHITPEKLAKQIAVLFKIKKNNEEKFKLIGIRAKKFIGKEYEPNKIYKEMLRQFF